MQSNASWSWTACPCAVPTERMTSSTSPPSLEPPQNDQDDLAAEPRTGVMEEADLLVRYPQARADRPRTHFFNRIRTKITCRIMQLRDGDAVGQQTQMSRPSPPFRTSTRREDGAGEPASCRDIRPFPIPLADRCSR